MRKIIKDFEGIKVSFNEEDKDLWLNITPVAKKFNKRIDNFWRDECEYVKEIENEYSLNMREFTKTYTLYYDSKT